MPQPRPPLLLDVDGVLNCLFVGVDGILDRGLSVHDAVANDGRSYRLLIEQHVPDLLLRVTEVLEIVWCTTWRNANDAISPLVGLPRNLDQVWLPSKWIEVPEELSRKTAFVRRWASDRHVTRLAWIDDEVTAADQQALRAMGSPSSRSAAWQNSILSTPPVRDVLTITTDPAIGVTEEQVETLLRWAMNANA